MEKCPPDWNLLKLGLINMKTKLTGRPIATHWAQIVTGVTIPADKVKII